MNPPRLALAILMIVPAVLFIAAAESAADTAPSAAASQADKGPASGSSQTAATPAKPSPPLRTAEPAIALPGTPSADQEATASILSAIRADPGMAGADVSVNADAGVVKLTGVVRNREQAALASAYANRPLGVLRVDNELSIPAQ